MSRIDHAAEANRLIGLSSVQPETSGSQAVSSAAQVHATLALVEQQRIANLIALADYAHHIPSSQIAQDARDALSAYREYKNDDIGGWYELRPNIAHSLGVDNERA